MKHLLIVLFLSAFSFSVFAQFPLGSNAKEITTYFNTNIPYLSAQDFKTANGTQALCITKVKQLGDYVFYFDAAGNCTSYIVTYDKKELADVTSRFDDKFVKIYATKWTAQDNTFDVTLLPPGVGDNFFSIVYKPLDASSITTNVMASN